MLLLTSADHDISDLDATDFDSLLLILQAKLNILLILDGNA